MLFFSYTILIEYIINDNRSTSPDLFSPDYYLQIKIYSERNWHNGHEHICADRIQDFKFGAMLRNIRDRVMEHVSAGRSLEEKKKMSSTKEFNEVRGGRFMSPDHFLAIV